MCREKLVELSELLKSNGYDSQVKEINKFVKESDFEGAYTLLIYYAKRINKDFVKGHKLPDVIQSLVPCTRCNGQGSSSKWAYTGSYCYECNGKGLVLKGVQTFRRYVKDYAEGLDIIKLEEVKQEKKERTFTVEYFKANTKEVTETFKFKVSELTDTTWTGIEKFVTSQLNASLSPTLKNKTSREYHNFANGLKLRIKF